MDITQFIILFVIGFFFGLTFRLFYARMNGNLRRPANKVTSQKVRYISPKLDERHEAADEEEDRYPERKVANR